MSARLITRYTEGKLLGIASGVEANAFLVSVTEDGAQVLDAANKKLLRRFPLGGKQVELVTAVVGDPDTSSYFAALRDPSRSVDYLVSWESSTDIVPLLSEISPRIPVDGKVDALHVLHTHDGSSAVVVLSDGSVAVPRWNDFKLQFLSTKAAKTACVLTQSMSDKLAVVTQQEGHDTLLEVYTYSQQGVSRTASFQPSAPKGSRITSISLSSGSIACLWSCGKLGVYNSNASRSYSSGLTYHLDSSLLPARASVCELGNTGTRKRKATSDSVAATNPATGFSMLAIDDRRLLFVTCQENDQVTAVVFDAQYGCVVSRATIALNPSPSHPAVLSLQSVADAVLLSIGDCTYSLDLDLPSSDLANLVGKLGVHSAASVAGLLSPADHSQRCLPQATVLERMDVARYVPLQAPQSSPSAHSDALRLKAVGTEGGAGTGDSGQAAASSSKSQQGAGGTARPHAELSRRANALLATMLEQQHQQAGSGVGRASTPNSVPSSSGKDGDNSNSQLLDEACSLLAQCHKQKVVITSQLPQLVCLQLAQAGRWQQLHVALQSHPLQSLHDCPSLLQLLFDSHQHRLIAVVCQMVQDMPVGSFAEVLSLALTPSEDADFAAARQQYKERVQSAAEASVRAAESRPADSARLLCARVAAAAVDGFSSEEVILHSLASVPLDPMALLAASRQLRGKQVHSFVRYLAKWVKKYSKQLGPGALPKGLAPVLTIPTYAQVLDWVKAVLDAHLAMLIVHKGLKQVLHSLRDVVGLQLETTEKLGRMRGIAEHMKASSALPAASMAAAASYTVELLDLRVVKQQQA